MKRRRILLVEGHRATLFHNVKANSQMPDFQLVRLTVRIAVGDKTSYPDE
jgi:hypothetical protein